MVIETNYGIKENLQNLVLLELNFNKNKELHRKFMEVGNELVDNEMVFMLNVTSLVRGIFMESQYLKPLSLSLLKQGNL